MRFSVFSLFLVLAVLWPANTIYAQYGNKLNEIETNINRGKLNNAFSGLLKIDTLKLNTGSLARYYEYNAKVLEGFNEDDKAFKNYLLSQNLYRKSGRKDKAEDINLDIAYLLFTDESTTINYRTYLNRYYTSASKNNDSIRMAKWHQLNASFLLTEKKFKESLFHFKKALALNNSRDMQFELGTYHNLSTLYNEGLNKPDSALLYLQKNFNYLIANNGTSNDLCNNLINQAASFFHLGNSKKAISLLKKADSIPINTAIYKTKETINKFMAYNYEALGDYPNAFEHLIASRDYADSLNAYEKSVAIQGLETKYRTKENEVANLILKKDNNINRILLYTFLGLLLATLVIGWLIVKNARRREKIASQDKLIEQQKLEKALKEYELQSIDNMLEGQEKERERIANDLHDNLGSMLATLKLNFENLKLRKSELASEENKLYERTDELIEEAYQKVRRLAHAKNAGVIANEGLLPAIKKLADKLTVPGKLAIHVIEFGFDSRLENTLEIAIFRMVQELCTNIVKHSQATEATIHLTHHEDIINIMIEDNGIGIKLNVSDIDDGMGLQTIKRKATQLGGSFTIDSTPGRGTTIIIDIPV